MSGQTLSITEQLDVMECHHCHMTYAMTQGFRAARRKDHQTFWCPAGHGAHYPAQSNEERLAKELKDAQAALSRSRAATRAATDQAEAAEKARARAELRRRAAVGSNTKLKNRIANGVCPCCRRSFQDLHKHMAGQHPDYALSATDD